MGSNNNNSKPVTRQTKLSISTSGDPTLADVMAKLTAMEVAMNEKLGPMNEKMDEVKEDVQTIRDTVGHLQTDVGDKEEQIGDLQRENELLREVNGEMMERVKMMERQMDDLENRSRRNNLVFYGMNKLQGETNADLEFRLKELCTDKLEFSDDVEFDRVHRTSAKPNAPVIARCTFYRDKISILKEKKKLKGTNIFVGEDYSRGVREIRKILSKLMKEKKAAGQSVSMVYDHLVMNGKKYFLAADGESLMEKQ